MSIQDDIARLGPWFHNLHLPGGAQTCPDHWLGDFPAFKWRQLAPLLPEDLRGRRALEIGCNAGFYTFELAKRGAHVTGIDVDAHYLEQARWAAEQFGLTSRVEFRQMQVYDLASFWDQFDLVLFMGVFYHLRYPLLALDLVAQKVNGTLVFQTLTMPGEDVHADTYDVPFAERDALTEPGWPKMAFLEHKFAGDLTNWWAPNRAGVEAMLRSSGLRITAAPGDELYLCEPDPDRPSCVATWNSGELSAAAGLGPRLKRTLTFKHCWVHCGLDYTETVFHDGTSVTASPESVEEYRAKAARYGYGADVGALSREHEILHTFLAEALGYGSSPTLWAVAHGQQNVAPLWEQIEEEGWVLAFQNYLNGDAPTEPLQRFVDYGLSLEDLKFRALALMRA